jgi:hypothetical protein
MVERNDHPQVSPEERSIRHNTWQLGQELKAANAPGADDHALDKFTQHVQKLYGDTYHRDRADEVMRRLNHNHRSDIEAKFGHVQIAGADAEGHVLTRTLGQNGRPADTNGVELRDGSGKKISDQLSMHEELRNGVTFKVGADGRGSYQLQPGEKLSNQKVQEAIKNFYGKDGEVPNNAEMARIAAGIRYNRNDNTIELPSLYRDVKTTQPDDPIGQFPGANGRQKIENPDKQTTVQYRDTQVQLRDGTSIPAKTTSEYMPDGHLKSETRKYGTEADQKSGHLPVFSIKRADGNEQVFAKVLEVDKTKSGHGWDNTVKMVNGQEVSFHTDGRDGRPQFSPPKLDAQATDGTLLDNNFSTRLRGPISEGQMQRFGAEWTRKTDQDFAGDKVTTVRDDQGNLRDQVSTFNPARPRTLSFTDSQGRDVQLDKVTEINKSWNEARNGYDVNITSDGRSYRFQTGRYGRDAEAVAPPATPQVGKAPQFDVRDRLGDGLQQPGLNARNEVVNNVSLVTNKFGWHQVESTTAAEGFRSFDAKISTVIDQQNRLAERTVQYTGDKPNWNGLHNVTQLHTVRNNDGTYTVTASADGATLLPRSGGNWQVQMDLQGKIIKDTWKSLDS